MNPISGYLQIAILAAAAVGGAGVGYWAEHKNRVAEVKTILADNAQVLQTVADKATAAARLALASNQASQAALAKNDSETLKGKNDALKQNEDLRAGSARAPDGGLRIKAVCPAVRGNDVPSQPGPSRVDDATSVAVSPETRQSVFDLRADIISDHAALAGLQRYVRETCPGPVTAPQ